MHFPDEDLGRLHRGGFLRGLISSRAIIHQRIGNGFLGDHLSVSLDHVVLKRLDRDRKLMRAATTSRH